MTARQTPAVPVDRRYLWSVADLAAMLGCEASTIRQHLRNGAGEKVTATDAVNGDTYVVWKRARIPAHKDGQNDSYLHFWRHEVEAAVYAATGHTLTA